MKNKILIGFFAALALSSPIYATSANSDLSVEIVRMQTLNGLIDKINLLHQTAEKYILQTGDLSPTVDKIDSLFGIDKSTWTNYDKNGYMSVSPETGEKNALIIRNFVSNNELSEANYIQNSRRLDALGNVVVVRKKEPDGTYKVEDIYVEFPLSPTLYSFINALKNDIPKEFPDAKVSYTAPKDAPTWLKPDGNGNFIVYKRSENGWKITGVYYPDKGFVSLNGVEEPILSSMEENVIPLIRVENISSLKGKILPQGSLATDIHGAVYVTDGKGNWYLLRENNSQTQTLDFASMVNSPISSYKVAFYSLPGAKGVFSIFSPAAISFSKLLVKNLKTGNYLMCSDMDTKKFLSKSVYQNGDYYLFLTPNQNVFFDLISGRFYPINNSKQSNESKIVFSDSCNGYSYFDIEGQKNFFTQSAFVALTNNNIYTNDKGLLQIVADLENQHIINPSEIKEVYITTVSNQQYPHGLILIKKDGTGILVNPDYQISTIKKPSDKNYIVLNKKISNIYFIDSAKSEFVILYNDGSADYFLTNAVVGGSGQYSEYCNFVVSSNKPYESFDMYSMKNTFVYAETPYNDPEKYAETLKKYLTNIKKVIVGASGFYLFDNNNQLKVGINITYDGFNYWKDLRPLNSPFKGDNISKIFSNNSAMLVFMKDGSIYFLNYRPVKLSVKASDIKHLSPLGGEGFVIQTKDGRLIPLSSDTMYEFKVPYIFSLYMKKFGIRKNLCISNYCITLLKTNKLLFWGMENVRHSWVPGMFIYSGADGLQVNKDLGIIDNVKDFQILRDGEVYFETLNGKKYIFNVDIDAIVTGYIELFYQDYTPANLPFVKELF